MVPVIAMAYVAFSFLGGMRAVQDQVENFLISNLAPSAADQATAYLREIQSKISPAALGVFGVLAFLYSCVSIIAQAEGALNQIWGAASTRPLWKQFLFYTLAVLVGPVVLGGSLAATTYLGQQFATDSFLSRPVAWTLALAPIATSSFLFALIYGYLPHARVRFRSALTAGAIVGIAFEALKQAYGLYAAYSLGKSVYGSLAALPILFLWFSLAAQIFLWGAEICYFLEERRAGVFHVAPPESALSVPMLADILRLIAAARDGGRQHLSLTDIVARLEWDQAEVFRHVSFLVESGALRRAGAERAENFAMELSGAADAIERMLGAVNHARYERWIQDGEAVAPYARSPRARSAGATSRGERALSASASSSSLSSSSSSSASPLLH